MSVQSLPQSAAVPPGPPPALHAIRKRGLVALGLIALASFLLGLQTATPSGCVELAAQAGHKMKPAEAVSLAAAHGGVGDKACPPPPKCPACKPTAAAGDSTRAKAADKEEASVEEARGPQAGGPPPPPPPRVDAALVGSGGEVPDAESAVAGVALTPAHGAAQPVAPLNLPAATGSFVDYPAWLAAQVLASADSALPRRTVKVPLHEPWDDRSEDDAEVGTLGALALPAPELLTPWLGWEATSKRAIRVSRAGARLEVAEEAWGPGNPRSVNSPYRKRQAAAAPVARRNLTMLDGTPIQRGGPAPDVLFVEHIYAEQLDQARPLKECQPLENGAVPADRVAALEYMIRDRTGMNVLEEPGVRPVAYLRPVSGQANPLLWPRMDPVSYATACAAASMVRPEFLPEGGCPDPSAEADDASGSEAGKSTVPRPQLTLEDEGRPIEPSWRGRLPYPLRGSTAAAPWTESGAWCAAWDNDAFLAELDCAWVDINGKHADVAFSILSENFGVMSAKRFLTWLDVDHPVREIPVLGVPSYCEYCDYPGHFANEMLFKLLWMDRVLPIEVPFLAPGAGDVPRTLLRTLQSPGIELINPDREFIFVLHQNSRQILRARRLYYFGTTSAANFPVTTWYGQNDLAGSLRALFARRAREADRLPSNAIVIMERPAGARSMGAQQFELQAAVQAVLTEAGHPNIQVILHLAKPNNFLATGDLLYGAALIVGAHGAALNNMVTMRPGTGVVEVGYVLKGFHWPSEFVCLARNLGLNYHALFGESNHNGPITIDVQHAANVIVDAWMQVTGSRGDAGAAKGTSPDKPAAAAAGGSEDA